MPGDVCLGRPPGSFNREGGSESTYSRQRKFDRIRCTRPHGRASGYPSRYGSGGVRLVGMSVEVWQRRPHQIPDDQGERSGVAGLHGARRDGRAQIFGCDGQDLTTPSGLFRSMSRSQRAAGRNLKIAKPVHGNRSFPLRCAKSPCRRATGGVARLLPSIVRGMSRGAPKAFHRVGRAALGAGLLAVQA